jgi:hypothetical protein
MPFAEQSSVEANELTISHSTIQSGIAFSVEDLKEVARNLQGSHVELQHHIQQLLEDSPHIVGFTIPRPRFPVHHGIYSHRQGKICPA